MSTLLVRNGRVIDPKNNRDEIVDILVKDGKIARVEKNITDEADQIIDVTGLIVTPGLVDLHVHFREPGREDMETLETGSRAALAGGVTSAVTMPNTATIADNQTVIEFVINRSRALNLISLYPAGATTKKTEGDILSEMWELKRSGAVAVTDDGLDVQDEGLLLKAMEYAKTHDVLVMSHCETDTLDEHGAMHEGWVSSELGLPGIPEVAEDVAVHKNILLGRRSGARFHLTHNSTKGAVQAIREAKRSGLTNITADVSVHHFALTDEECRGYNTNAKMFPPLRPEDHRLAIIEALKDGTVDAITTDHAPHIEPDKIKPFSDAARGTVGIETSFAVMNTYLVQPGHLSLSQGIALMTHKPAEIIRINKGTLSEGADADIAIFNIEERWTVDPATFQSKGKNSVFVGKELAGKAVHVVVGGAVKMKDGRIQ
jgi:dihydroorotase